MLSSVKHVAEGENYPDYCYTPNPNYNPKCKEAVTQIPMEDENGTYYKLEIHRYLS